MADIRHVFGAQIPTSDRRLYAYLGVLLLGLLGVEAVPLPTQTYIAPATSLLAALALPLLLYRTRTIRPSPLLFAVSLFVGYSLALSLIFVVVDLLTLDVGLNRVWLFARQVIALGIGVSVFYVLRRLLTRYRTADVARIIALGSIPSLVAAWLTLGWQFTNVDVLAALPLAMRQFAPSGYDGLSRTSGLMSEPSHFAFFLVTVLIPALFLGYHRARVMGRDWRVWVIGGVATLVAFVGTLSTSGVLLLVVFVGAYALLSGRWRLSAGGVTVCLIAAIVFVLLFPETYLSRQLTRLATLNWRTSILTRFYSTMGPFITAFTSVHGFLGYGLGGTNAHIHEIVPPAGVEGLTGVSWENAVNLKTLFGRVVAETGIPGLSLFVLMFGAAYAELARLHDYAFKPWEWSFESRVIATALVTTAFGHGIAMGSFAIPFLWMWLAVVDSKNLQP